ncbi:MAG: NADH-quinone oxidoreductase subunit J [Oligoflexia bacterium]|nr:NADH-quinone oxidoreductase subunit J [Oligoflexia bacterium]
MTALFFLVALVLLISAVGVVASRNAIHSALFLVGNLMSVAVMFAMLNAHFLAVVQVIVYAGAIMVLVLFVLMLLNIKLENQPALGKLVIGLAGLGGLAFLWMMVPLLQRSFAAIPQSAVDVQGSVREVGKLLYTQYVFPFEAASLLIMAAVVGAVMLAKRRYRA